MQIFIAVQNNAAVLKDQIRCLYRNELFHVNICIQVFQIAE